ncbi:DNA helicase [Streptomyces peucetius]|uniref:DNA helicase n=1 Tax=Streptomyces peucetius TaxID=1950 RepID=A0ABY6IF21_STRPE|nr:DNA helicase [Streptomyces peucetius]UYQ65606.1 DNA helicase [Streptomyces peucetius]
MTVTYLDLTPGQRASLEGLPFDGHHVISGPPGSGKSLLASQRAVMLALTGGPSVLLTRSNLLRQAINPAVKALGPERDGVVVATAHSWLARWYQDRAGVEAPRTDDGWYDWSALVQQAALTEPVPGLSVVVDEGQDLPVGFYRFCRVLGARVTVYADECQRLTDTHSTLAEIGKALGGCEMREVDGNHRNTRQIAELAQHFHVGRIVPALPERDGPPPFLHSLSRPGAVTDLLVGMAQSYPRRTIGVVLNSTMAQFDLLTRLERTAPRLKPQMYTAQATQGRYRTLDLARPGVVIVNRASAKGLGFDHVVVPDTHTDAGTDPTSAALRMAYYVLATRARHELHLGYEGEAEPPLTAQIPRHVLLRR